MLAPTGESCGSTREDDLDAVTALSGSGPAYVFYFVEAMMQAAAEMGLSEAQGRQLALATFAGATALAQGSTTRRRVLRERVTSKGGTTHAALSSLEASGVEGGLRAGTEGGAAARARTRRRVRRLSDPVLVRPEHRRKGHAGPLRGPVADAPTPPIPCKAGMAVPRRLRAGSRLQCRPMPAAAPPCATSARRARHAGHGTHHFETTMSYLSYVSHHRDTAPGTPTSRRSTACCPTSGTWPAGPRR